MIGCAEAVRQLWDYLENQVEEADREQIEHHLAFCRRCCGEVEFAEELRAFMDRGTKPDLPAAVERRLTGFLEELEGEGAP